MDLSTHSTGRLPIGLCVFGLTYHCGLTWAGTAKANPQPLSAEQIMDLAAGSGLSHVELSVPLMGGASPERLDALRSYAEARGLGFVVASGLVCEADLQEALVVAARLGAPTVRCTLSKVLCGDRRGFPGGWRAHLERCAAELERVVPEAERLQVAIGVENHQDADSEDLLALCRRFESRYLGVTLDCANPLAVMEEPVAFAERLAPYLRHAHLKDYRIHPAHNGFRLVRCALGEGVIDYPALFRLFAAQEWPITRSIEMAALQARQIPMVERSWWDEYAPRDARDTLPALSLVWQNLRPADEEWRTPFELDASGEELGAWELQQYHASVEYLRSLGASGTS
jgi:sugar phosphate isomerase/epimerase